MSTMDWATLAVALFIHLLAWATMWSVLCERLKKREKLEEAKRWHINTVAGVMGFFWLPLIIYCCLVKLFIWGTE